MSINFGFCWVKTKRVKQRCQSIAFSSIVFVQQNVTKSHVFCSLIYEVNYATFGQIVFKLA